MTGAGSAVDVPYFYPLQTNASNPGAVLRSKIQYANKRWGATLFYVDSNLSWDGVVNAASYFQDLLRTFPRLLIFPEWSNVRHYAYAIRYLDATAGRSQPSADVMHVYPDAIGLVAVPGDSQMSATHDALIQAVRKGNILLFDGWYRHPANDAVVQIYSEAGRGNNLNLWKAP